MGAQRYRSGPGLMDLAVLLPSGKWMRMANGVQLSAEQVATWHELSAAPVVEESLHVVRVDAREIDKIVALGATYTEDAEHLTFSSLVETIEKGAYERGLAASAPAPQASTEKLTPAEIKWLLLAEFGNAWWAMGEEKGLTMRSAADLSGVAVRANYTSRFGSDLIKDGWIEETGRKAGHSKIFQITEAGLREVRRVVEGKFSS